MTVTLARLRHLFDYDPSIGLFVRHVRVANRPKGEVAGTITESGHVRIAIDGKDYYAHRLAWFWVTGEWPSELIDHRNGRPTDNRFKNLRDDTAYVNNQNQRRAHRDSSTGLLGVSWVTAKGRYRASITINRKAHYLGYFDNPEDAHRRYLEVKRSVHEGCLI